MAESCSSLLGGAIPAVLGRLNLAAIAPYPLLMVILVVTGLVDRPLGQLLVLVDGAVVGALAAVHARALLRSQPDLDHQPA